MIASFRSWVFSLLFVLNTFFWSLILLPLLLLPYSFAVWAGRIWAWTSLFLAKLVMGINYDIKGKEHVPSGSAIVASMHQSAWETVAFFLLLTKPTYILKKELTYIPIWGLYFPGLKMIAIKRSAGASALKMMVKRSCERLEAGHQVIIFPQGTRLAYGEKKPLHPGVAAIYNKANVPLVPVTLNSGKCWPKKGYKHSGTITVTFHAPLIPGQKKEAVLGQLEKIFYAEEV